MRIAFSGAEVAAHRTMLLGEGANLMALNLSAYFKQRQPMEMKDAYDGIAMVLYTSEGGLDPMRVAEFIGNNGDRFEAIYGLPGDGTEVFIPEWSGSDVHDFYRLTEHHTRVGITEDVALNGSLMPSIAAYVRREGIELWVSSSKAEVLSMPVWETAIVGAWISASKYRELQVWDGSHVARYPRARRADGLERHNAQILRLGGDPEAIAAEDTPATTRLAVRSWLQYEQRIAKVVAIDTRQVLSGVVHDDGESIAIAPAPTRNRERTALPILAPVAPPVSPSDGPHEPQHLVSQVPLRSCSACYLSAMCPAYEAGASCAYSIPIRITTKTELVASLNAMLEMQAQRVFMARFAEDLLSQGIDPTVSAELERFMRMVESTKKISENRTELTISARGADAGAISRLFGADAGKAQLQLDRPVLSDDVMGVVVDAELVE